MESRDNTSNAEEGRPWCHVIAVRVTPWMSLGLLWTARGYLWHWSDSLQREDKINWYTEADNSENTQESGN